MELRRFSRAPIQQPLLFAPKGDESYVEGTATDVSLGGMFIQTATPAPFNCEVVLHTYLEGSEEQLALPAIVRWMRPDGMGVQFQLLGARETFVITEIVRRYEAAQA